MRKFPRSDATREDRTDEDNERMRDTAVLKDSSGVVFC